MESIKNRTSIRKYAEKEVSEELLNHTIPEREIGDEMPVYGDYDDAYREALKPYIENLNNARGLIDCPEAFQLALKLKDENAEFARLSQDRTFENLSFRANVIAYLKACVLYVANG